MTYFAGGNMALSVAMTTLSTLLAPLFTPLMMRLLAHRDVPVEFSALAFSIFRIVVIPVVAGRPNSTGERARLRDNWQDIGGDRFVQANQNGLIQSMGYFSYPAAFTVGNGGRNTFDRQRFIDTQFSASKEWMIKERATVEFRFDFQNPFKWYNLSAPNTTVNFTNPATFGKVSTSTSDEGTTANAGGQGLMNITLSFRF